LQTPVDFTGSQLALTAPITCLDHFLLVGLVSFGVGFGSKFSGEHFAY